MRAGIALALLATGPAPLSPRSLLDASHPPPSALRISGTLRVDDRVQLLPSGGILERHDGVHVQWFSPFGTTTAAWGLARHGLGALALGDLTVLGDVVDARWRSDGGADVSWTRAVGRVDERGRPVMARFVGLRLGWTYDGTSPSTFEVVSPELRTVLSLRLQEQQHADQQTYEDPSDHADHPVHDRG